MENIGFIQTNRWNFSIIGLDKAIWRVKRKGLKRLQNSTRAIGKNELAAANNGVWILWANSGFSSMRDTIMKILILNGSPKRDAGDTMHLTRAFTDGMSETQKNEIHAHSNSETT